MGYKIIFNKRYSQNIVNVLTYLEQEWGKKVADDFQDRLNKTLQILKQQPFIGSPSRKVPNVRGLLITKHNRPFYKIENNTIVIISLADTRRKSYE